MLSTTKNIWLRSQRIRYLFVGGYNTVFGYVAFAAAYWLLNEKVHYVGLAVAAHFLAVTNSFLTQRYFVFRSSGCWKKEFLRFQLGYLTMLPVGIGLLAFFYEIAGMPILLAQAATMFIGVVMSYVIHKHFTFSTR